MTHLLKISEAASLAMHTTVLLAAKPEEMFSARAVAQLLGVSENHLSKVMQRLSKAGLVESSRGPHGGFRLTRPGDTIALIEVYEAIEGPLVMDQCLLSSIRKCSAEKCILGNLLKNVYTQVKEYFEATKLTDLSDIFNN